MAIRNQNFFMLPNHWRFDPDVAGLPLSAQVAFLALVEMCQQVQNSGVMTWAQINSTVRGIERGHAAVARLIDAGSLTVTQATAVGSTGDTLPSTGDARSIPARDAVVTLTNAHRWLFVSNTPKPINAGKGGGSGASGVEEQKQPRARVKTDRQTDRESIRSPSGSDRIDSARAAPRGAGGAARPAPVDGSPPAGSVVGDDQTTMSRAEAIAAARTAIRNGQQKSPHSTGKNVAFSRYDPDRPIIPLKSGFTINGDGE